MRCLLLAGGPTHDFAATSSALIEVLEPLGARTTVVDEPALALDALRAAPAGDAEPWDLLVVDALRWRMEVDRYAALRERWAFSLGDDDAAVLAAHVAGGGGLLALHTAVICFDAHPRWHELLGASWSWERSSHPPLGTVAVRATAAGEQHPATQGTAPFEVVDELYRDLEVDPDVVPLAVGATSGVEAPVLWARTHGAGRVVVDLLGHGPESLTHPDHRTLLARCARWAARAEQPAAPRGAR